MKFAELWSLQRLKFNIYRTILHITFVEQFLSAIVLDIYRKIVKFRILLEVQT